MLDNSSLFADSPLPITTRWVARRKAVVVNEVLSGAISLQEACRRYELSVEEFLAWQRAIETNGVPGLRATRVQIYRDTAVPGMTKPPATEGSIQSPVSNLSTGKG